MTINKILCPIDLSELSILGLRQAAEIAKEHQAELIVMHVSNDFFRADQTSHYYTLSMTTFLDEVQKLKRIVHDLQDLNCQAHHCLGNPPHEIVEYAKREACDLIVVGSHGRSGFKKMILGSVAEKVIATAETSVLVVRQPGNEGAGQAFRSRGIQPVVVPFDFSEACLAALRFTRKLGIDPARLHVINVAEPPEPYTEQSLSKQKRESEMISANRARFYEQSCPVEFRAAEFRTLFDLDIPGRIGNHANEIGATLIVMPTNQKSFLTRFFLGSVANTVARTSPCPTLIVKSERSREDRPDPPGQERSSDGESREIRQS